MEVSFGAELNLGSKNTVQAVPEPRRPCDNVQPKSQAGSDKNWFQARLLGYPNALQGRIAFRLELCDQVHGQTCVVTGKNWQIVREVPKLYLTQILAFFPMVEMRRSRHGFAQISILCFKMSSFPQKAPFMTQMITSAQDRKPRVVTGPCGWVVSCAFGKLSTDFGTN